MLIDKIVITGADDSTDINDLLKLSAKFNKVEWGILKSKKCAYGPRFPSEEWIHKLRNQPINFCFHNCGGLVRDVSNGKWGEINYSPRIQFNFGSRIKYVNIMKFVDNFPFKPPIDIIIQISNNMDIYYTKIFTYALSWELNKHIQILPFFDNSAGRGELTSEFKPPIHEIQGYAGGFSPDNIKDELNKINIITNKNQHIWIDVETHVRTEDNLDMAKVEDFLHNVEEWELNQNKT